MHFLLRFLLVLLHAFLYFHVGCDLGLFLFLFLLWSLSIRLYVWLDVAINFAIAHIPNPLVSLSCGDVVFFAPA
jgi:hypothetical protein